MTPDELAGLHARAFAGQGRGWSAAEFETLLKDPHVFLVTGAQAFGLGRAVAGEAELLTLATAPEARRGGQGRACLAAIEAEATARGAARLFLEVASDNAAAVALYRSAGFGEIARRNAYYTRPEGGRVDALIFEKQLV